MHETRHLRGRHAVFASAFLILCVVAGVVAGRHFAGVDEGPPAASYRIGDHGPSAPGTENTVVIYTMTTCDPSQQAKRWLGDRGIAYDERVVDQSDTALLQARNAGARRTPVMLIGKYQVEGFDPDLAERLLARENITASAGR